MSNLSLSRKIEKILTSYITELIDDEALNIYEGHEKFTPYFPSLIVFAEDATPHPEMPTSTGIKNVLIRFDLRVDSEDIGTDEAPADPRLQLDGWRKTVEDIMGDIEAMMAFINAPDTLPDNREVTDVHVYDATPSGEPSDFDKTDWIEQVVFEVLAQPLDPQS